jgi:hypothetical protein
VLGVAPLSDTSIPADALEGHPSHDPITKAKFIYLTCAGKTGGGKKRRWAYCKTAQSYLCCPSDQTCDESGSTPVCR